MIELPLRDIHLPDPISWWPLAPGWWMVLGGILLLCFIVAMILRKIFKPTLKKQASRVLDRIEQTFHETENATGCLSELSVFLRRVVLSRNDPLKSAGLTGKAWLELLDEPLKEPEFSQGVGQILLKGPYQSKVEKEDVSQLIQLCRKWVNCL